MKNFEFEAFILKIFPKKFHHRYFDPSFAIQDQICQIHEIKLSRILSKTLRPLMRVVKIYLRDPSWCCYVGFHFDKCRQKT